VAPPDLRQMLPDVFTQERIRPTFAKTCLPILTSGQVKLLALRRNPARVPLFARSQDDPYWLVGGDSSHFDHGVAPPRFVCS
jgi:hypothetical protein